MRLIALAPVGALAIALILAFLCTFAGTNRDMLEYYDIFTLNTSRIAVNIFNTTEATNNDSQPTSDNPISTFFHKVGDEIKNKTDGYEAEIEQALNNAVESFAKSLGLKDFYSIHVMDHCEGFFHPNGTSSRNVTHCSNSTGFSHFTPGETLAKELNATGVPIDLADLHWPGEIDRAVRSLKLAFNVMFVLYIIGIIAIGLALFGSLLGVFFHGRASACGNIILTQLAFFALLISSAIITVGACKTTDVINNYGKEIDVSAARGNRLIAMTWTADVLVLLASIAWVVELIRGKRKEKMIPKQMQ